MDDAAKAKARETRRRNKELRDRHWREQLETERATRAALRRIVANPEASPEQVLEAIKRLEKNGNY